MKPRKKIEVSIITVAYKNEKVLKRLLDSVPNDSSLEVIVIDNTKNNRGFAKACNEGAKKARGSYLFFVNPDCVLNKETIPLLLERIKKDTKIGIIGPQLKNDGGEAYLSTTQQPTVWSAPIVYSALNKLPNNIKRRHWYEGQSLEKEKEVGSISGAAMLMRRDVFWEVGGFDEHFFLYWEDNDICRRVLQHGYTILYYPKTYVVHSKGKSTDIKKKAVIETFKASRWYFFAKHFGKVYATVLEAWFALFEEWKLLLIIGLAAFLRFDRITTLMPLIGDQGRDFLAALQALQTGQLPLLGIHSSIPRFQQGPVYIWMLTALFGLFGAQAEWAGILSSLLGLLAVIAAYFLAYRFLNKRAALITALILAVSPLVVTQSRLAFMTNPIPLVSVLLLWFLQSKLTSIRRFGLVTFSWALLFQFELVAAPLVMLVVAFWFVRYFSDKSRRIGSLIWGLVGIAIGLMPQIIFDLTHNFRQLGMFGVWVGYRLASFFGFDAEHAISTNKLTTYWTSLESYLNKFWDWANVWGVYLSLLLLALAIWKQSWKFKRTKQLSLIGWSALWLLIQLLAYLVHGAPSEAYFPLLFVPLALIAAWLVTTLPVRVYQVGITALLIWAAITSISLVQHDYYVATEKNGGKPWQTYGLPLSYQKEIVQFVLGKTGNQSVTYRTLGEGAQFASFMDGYSFLTISLGGVVDNTRGVPVYIFNRVGTLSVQDYWLYELYGTTIALPRVYEAEN